MSVQIKRLEVAGPQTLGGRVRMLRIQRGMTQDELAARIGGRWPFSKSFISLVEHGRATPSLPTFRALVRALGTSADYLLFGDENQPKPPQRDRDSPIVDSKLGEELGPGGGGAQRRILASETDRQQDASAV